MLQDAKVTVLRHDDTGDITSACRHPPARSRCGCAASSRRPTRSAGATGCDSRFRLEIDHIEPLAAGGRTEKANLWRLCGHDHHLKTHRRWRAITLPDGTHDLAPPDTPDPPLRE